MIFIFKLKVLDNPRWYVKKECEVQHYWIEFLFGHFSLSKPFISHETKSFLFSNFNFSIILDDMQKKRMKSNITNLSFSYQIENTIFQFMKKFTILFSKILKHFVVCKPFILFETISYLFSNLNFWIIQDDMQKQRMNSNITNLALNLKNPNTMRPGPLTKGREGGTPRKEYTKIKRPFTT